MFRDILKACGLSRWLLCAVGTANSQGGVKVVHFRAGTALGGYFYQKGGQIWCVSERVLLLGFVSLRKGVHVWCIFERVLLLSIVFIIIWTHGSEFCSTRF